ncbi:MAG: S1C family serine protease [Dehalococcoidia bacterium]
MRTISLALILIAAAALVGCTDEPTSAQGSPTAAPGTSTPATSTATAAATRSGGAASPAGGDDFAGAVQRVAAAVKPAVVQITTEEVQQNPFGQQGSPVPTGVGTGVFFDDQGHILTNNHVIEGASRIRVSLADGRSFPGTLVGGDAQTDLAVVRVEGDNLPRADLGNSDELEVGEWVVAIGHALGLVGGPTVTTGVVSALDRTVQEPGGQGGGGGPFLFGVIQTDASINPGNSGGPLVDLDGQVVGLNTLVAGQAGPGGAPAEGIGFAISANTARRIAQDLLDDGRVVHAYLGVRYVALTPAVASQLGIEGVTQGALVGEVVSGSPAAQAGLRAEDVITKIEGEELQGESALAQKVDSRKPGDTITLTVRRGTETTDLRATLGEAPGGS